MEWYKKVMQKYFVFSGRASRKEYWMFYLVNLLVAAVLAFLGNIMTAFAFIYVLYLAAMIIPGFAVTIRRIHDINKSALWFLIVFIPFIGPFILLYMMCTPGTQGDNDFGTDPQLEIV